MIVSEKFADLPVQTPTIKRDRFLLRARRAFAVVSERAHAGRLRSLLAVQRQAATSTPLASAPRSFYFAHLIGKPPRFNGQAKQLVGESLAIIGLKLGRINLTHDRAQFSAKSLNIAPGLERRLVSRCEPFSQHLFADIGHFPSCCATNQG
jgi:hypothetical protein